MLPKSIVNRTTPHTSHALVLSVVAVLGALGLPGSTHAQSAVRLGAEFVQAQKSPHATAELHTWPTRPAATGPTATRPPSTYPPRSKQPLIPTKPFAPRATLAATKTAEFDPTPTLPTEPMNSAARPIVAPTSNKAHRSSSEASAKRLAGRLDDLAMTEDSKSGNRPAQTILRQSSPAGADRVQRVLARRVSTPSKASSVRPVICEPVRLSPPRPDGASVRPSSGRVQLGASFRALALVLGLFFGAICIVRRLGLWPGQTNHEPALFQVLGEFPLMRGRRAIVLQFGKRLLILADGRGGLEKLAEVTDEAEMENVKAICRPATTDPSVGSFNDWLLRHGLQSGTSDWRPTASLGGCSK